MGFLDPQNAPQSTYQATPDALNLQQYGPAIQQALSNYNATNGRQNELVSMLLSPGGGPNLANAQLQQATQQNNLQGAGAIASTRGLNPALAARQILDTTAAQNQAAAAQSSINRLAQVQSSRELAANVLGQQQNANAAMYGTGANANNAQNNALVNQQNINAATANQNASIQNQAYQRQAQFWQNLIGTGLQTVGNLAGLGGISGLLKPMSGGESLGAPNINGTGPGQVQTVQLPADVSMPGASSSGVLPVAKAAGGLIEQGDGLSDLLSVASTAARVAPLFGLLQAGGRVPGRAVVAGNSPRNDIVPAMLSPGEVVIPRTIAQDPEAAADFIRAIKARRKAA